MAARPPEVKIRTLLPPLVVATLLLNGCGDEDELTLADPTTRSTVPATEQPTTPEAVTGRVVGVDRDGPSVEIIETTTVTGAEATEAARRDGRIDPEEASDLEFYVVEGRRRWLDLEPNAAVAVYDCSQGCEHVEGTLDDLLSGAPYGGAGASWNLELLQGRAISAAEVYTP